MPSLVGSLGGGRILHHWPVCMFCMMVVDPGWMGVWSPRLLEW
jgi:hypothetical protein